MHAGSLIEQYAFAWRITRDPRWLDCAKKWLLAAAAWEHGDHLEEHFYTANRYMHAFAVGLDWLAGNLTSDEEARVTKTLVQLMTRWWPEVEQNRHSPQAGHHVVVDNGHFGVAAIQLLGHHPAASQWVAAVIDRFRAAIMPHGCGGDGEPIDGPTFWDAENMWMLHFIDALRNVVGIDLAREFPRRLTDPLKWIRYYLAPPRRMSSKGLHASANASLLTGSPAHQLDSCSPVLLRLAQEAGDAALREIALRDPWLGRIHRFGAGVKNSVAECNISWGPYAWLFYDPAFAAPKKSTAWPVSKLFAGAPHGEVALLRSSWNNGAVIAQIQGYNGGVAHGFSNLHIQWAGFPLLKTISAAEAVPVACGNLPCVGGQNEIISLLKPLATTADRDRVGVAGVRTRQECWLLRGRQPALLLALQRKPRGVCVTSDGGETFARLDGGDFLQYPREPHFNATAGELRLRARLHNAPDPQRPQILFSVGVGIPSTGLGTGVNQFWIGFVGGSGLTFGIVSQQYLAAKATLPPERAAMRPGYWHEIVARWGGLNVPGDKPFIELELDGRQQRFDDQTFFGELKTDTQGLKSRITPRTFRVKPNTVLAFGAAVQVPGTGLACDIARIQLVCPGRKPLRINFKEGLTGETGSDPLQWKFNPVQLVRRMEREAILGAGPGRVRILPLPGGGASFAAERVPFSHSGLAAASLKSLRPNAEAAARRLRITADAGDHLLLLFADAATRVRVKPRPQGFDLTLGNCHRRFRLAGAGPEILRHEAEKT